MSGEEILHFLSDQRREQIAALEQWQQATEIRLVAGGMASLHWGNKFQPLGTSPVTFVEVGETLARACEHSVYAAQPQLIRGYVTVRGGHRIGVAGKAAFQNGKLSAVTEISALCIRIARDKPRAAEALLPPILSEHGVKNTLLIGKPGSGKTTCLRSLSYLLGGMTYGKKVVVIDTRGELASVWRGTPQLSVGMLTCVLDRFPKKEAIEHAVRALAPDVIVTDELGAPEDTEAVLYAMTAGVSLLASVHGESMNEIKERPELNTLLSSGLIHQGILLGNMPMPGTLKGKITDF